MSEAASLREELSPISPTSLGKYVNLQRCGQYLGWELLAEGLFSTDSRFEESLLSPLYAETGTQFEHEQVIALEEEIEADTVIGSDDEDIEDMAFDATWEAPYEETLDTIVDKVEAVASSSSETTVVLLQPPMEGQIGAWRVGGKADIIVIREPRPNEDGDVVVDVMEVKSSSQEQTSHRIQAASYSKLIRAQLDRTAGETLAPTLNGYIVTRENTLMTGEYESLESFDLEPVEADIQMLLREGGGIDRVVFDTEGNEDVNLTDVDQVDPWEMTNRISRRCAGCDYHDVCYTRAVENDEISLLGLPEGTQERLTEVGITSLSDLAELYHFPEHTNPLGFENDDDPFRIKDEALVREIQNEIGIKDLERWAHAAAVFSRECDPSERPGDATYIRQSGYNLPRGEPREVSEYADYPNQSLIRVNLYVQEDGIRDRLDLLGAYVINYSTEEERYVSTVTESLPMDVSDKDEVEHTLLQDFLRDLVEAIRAVAPEGVASSVDASEYEYPLAEAGFVHLYFYNEAQRNGLMRAAKRHIGSGDGEFEALRTLLGLRTEIDQQEIDQEMVSVLREEFVMRHLLRFAGFGLVQTVEQFTRPNPEGESAGNYRGELHDWKFNWDHEVAGEIMDIPLQHLFEPGLFENAVDYSSSWGDIELDLESGPHLTSLESYYSEFPFKHRYADQAPLEYIWCALGELSPDWIDPEAFDDPSKGEELRREIQRYQYVDDPGTSRSVEPRHLEALAEKMAAAIEHIEASIPEGYKNAFVPKEPLPLDQLLELEFTDSELELTAREYLDLEHGSKERQLRRDWRQPIDYRLTGGRSVAFRCTGGPDGETNRIEGERWSSPGLDSESTRSESGISEGDWVVMTPLDTDADPPDEIGVQQATDIAQMPLVHVVSADEERIVVDAPWNDWDWPSRYHDFMEGHHRLVSRSERPDTPPEQAVVDGEDGKEVLVDEDMVFILDPALDQVVSYHASRALDNSEDNHVLEWLNDLLTGDRTTMETELCEAAHIEGDDASFIESEFAEVDAYDATPNEPQRRFIRDTKRHVVVVQGPPGTGKTSYTTSPAVLGRAYAFEQEDRDFTACVSALSHDAVDELFDQLETVARDRRRDAVFSNLKLVRVRPSSTPDDAVPYDERDPEQLVEHIAYHDDHGAQRLQELCEQYIVNEGGTDGSPTQLLLCGPPTSLRGAVDKMTPAMLDGDELDRDIDHDPGVWDLLREGDSDLFDLTVVDEASMMDLPLLFLAGAFLGADGQLLLAGDHRQMQPIQSHQWEDEDRETIEETVPFLSALDYIRFLKGDIGEVDFIERDSPELDDALGPMQQEWAVLPIYPLTQSFRLPDPVAGLLTELFYADDNIELEGVDRDPIPEVDSGFAHIDELLSPDAWVSVLIHSGEEDRRSSDIEASIAQQVTDQFEVVSPDVEPTENQISAGVVIPFGDQRDRLQRSLDDAIQAETVEKFQGGERDLIVMSMVASDPGYVNMISEFLLSPYRFNVAASRMKRKLVIIASDAVFQTSHPDADTYEDQIAWKRLYELTGALDPDAAPAEAGPIQDIDPSLAEDASYEVYHADLDDL